MKLSDFDYSLPENLIAQMPLHRREQARVMVIDRKQKTIRHDLFTHIDRYLPERSCLVLNDSKVIPARLLGKRDTGGQVEIFLLKKMADGYSYQALLRPLKRLRQDEKIIFNGGALVAQITDRNQRIVRFNRKNIARQLEQIGRLPLPPYIKRHDRAEDWKYYQTVYAKKEGSVASPTAGLHFTNRLLSRLAREGHVLAKVTLHINYATFKPVDEENIIDHQMHAEEYCVGQKARTILCATKEQKRTVVAVGTTSCRVLETLADARQKRKVRGDLKGSTDIFIYPGYQFLMTDILLTNFHLPKSTLLMLVYAFGGMDLMKRAYREAVRQKYRFYSYGDAMLIL